MRLRDSELQLSATDLSAHLGCHHLTHLEQLRTAGEATPPRWRDPRAEILRKRGFEHEEAYLEHLREQGLEVVGADEAGVYGLETTRLLMARGVDAVAQAVLASGRWQGRADVLRRVPRPSELGDWSYEVVDTKLAKETRAGTVLQLCLYSDLLAELQGVAPEYMHVVSPGRAYEAEPFRVDDFAAYYRFVRQQLESFVWRGDRSPAAETYPEPVTQCDVCRWWPACDRRRRADDHLCLVAGISRLQRGELDDWGVSTLEELARLPLPLERKPRRGSTQSLTRAREQARVQLEGRVSGEPVYELLPPEPERGLARLPVPSAGDLFFDIEGDPFVGEGGLEYLFGWVTLDEAGATSYSSRWALNRCDEREMFEAFLDGVMKRWTRYPDLHIYHYAPYEPSALKRLMGRYATHEDVVDRMLRAGLFVDLYGVVRQSLRASVEKYSIKDLEIFYGFDRDAELREASVSLRALEHSLELDDVESVPQGVRDTVEAYNRDDCLSTVRLREWLERLRLEAEETGHTVARPEIGTGDPSEVVDERHQRVHQLMDRLTLDVPAEPGERTDTEHARWLLAEMLEWHRREMKAPWWEYFRLVGLSDEDLLAEKSALAGLEFAGRVGGTDRSPIHRYSYPRQDTDVRDDDSVRTGDGEDLGTIQQINLIDRTVDVKKRGAMSDVHPTSLFEHSLVSTKALSESLMGLGASVAHRGIDGPGPFRAARDLLLKRPPRLKDESGTSLVNESEDALSAARRLAGGLEGGVLPIQGPPGAGKTYTGARMICELVRAGKKVGITAVSHKVIRNLLDEVVAAASEGNLRLNCVQKVSDKPSEDDGPIREVRSNAKVLDALTEEEVQVAAGTAWLWAREEFFESIDVLFVDEAGQMSLANVLAVAQAAKNLVLLGDPQQLEQPQQGSHPEGTDVSALEHLLDGNRTIAAARGLFLEETWRLHPRICAFTSELFYENRLGSRLELGQQTVRGSSLITTPGLWFAPIHHEANQSSCPEEVDRIVEIVEQLLTEGPSWVDREGVTHALTIDDILIVAPYNAQVGDLGERLPAARIGTVDKFQGQEAPIVIYSMTTSSPEDAPRGMEFLYSLNRLNVATSRARCACVLVANPCLFEPECRTPRQMQLANAFCRYLEMANEL